MVDRLITKTTQAVLSIALLGAVPTAVKVTGIILALLAAGLLAIEPGRRSEGMTA